MHALDPEGRDNNKPSVFVRVVGMKKQVLDQMLGKSTFEEVEVGRHEYLKASFYVSLLKQVCTVRALVFSSPR